MTITTIQGDCRDVLSTMPERSVQCVVTSPPYYGLRRYSDDPREIGQEATPGEYVAALVDVFRQVRRVLRDDGTCWLNIGDSYGEDKQLLMIPARVALALQADGWILRSDVVWAKPSCMPESVQDRPTRSHEYVFLLSKKPKYYYDAQAIAEPIAKGAAGSRFDTGKTGINGMGRVQEGERTDSATRNKRTVWSISSQPYPGSHYATMPEALIEPCVLAGSAAQACEYCGAAWGRVVERETDIVNLDEGARQQHRSAGAQTGGTQRVTLGVTEHVKRRDLGFAPRCACPENTGSARSVVLDPFAGSGTVLRVAARYQRDAIGIELNQEYIEQHVERRTNGLQIEMFT